LILSAERLQAAAASTGFRADVLEKVAHLLGLLSGIQAYPQLMNKYALKGGTALNLFHFPVPRLSVDIDLNYIGQLEREAMLQDRIHTEQLLKRVFSALDFQLVREPAETHAGGKWRLSYRSYTGQLGTIEVDLNYQYRQPLWPVTYIDSYTLGPWQAQGIPVFDMYELAGGKLAALFSRRKARDLFDVYQVLQLTHLDTQKLRQVFVIYGAMNRKDWRTITLGDLNIDPDEFNAQLGFSNSQPERIRCTLHDSSSHLARRQSR